MPMRKPIKLNRGRDMAQGEHKTVGIADVAYDDARGRVDVTFKDDTGTIHSTFEVGTEGSEQTDRQVKALERLSMLAEAALGGPCDDLDPEALVGRRVCATVWDNTVPDRRTGQQRTFRNIGYFEAVEDTSPEEEPHDEPNGGPGQGVPFGYQPEDGQ